MHAVGGRPGYVRVAVAGALVLASAAFGSVGAARADGSDSYLAVSVNGEPVNVEAALDSAGFDVMSRNYTVCGDSGPSQTLTLTGWSVQRVLQAAGVTPDEVSSISVPRIANSGDVVLHPADYDPAASGYPTFPEGSALVVRRTTGADQTPADDFFRPYRSPDCASNPNADDHVTTPVGTVLTVQIASGTQLQVSDTVDHGQVSIGQDATFTASVANPRAGETLTYRWQFGDGALGSGQTVSHAYTGTGSYPVLLTVDSGAAAGGAAAPLTVTVGSAAGPAGAGKTPSPTKTQPGTTARPGPTTARTTKARASVARTSAAPPSAPTAVTPSARVTPAPSTPSVALSADPLATLPAAVAPTPALAGPLPSGSPTVAPTGPPGEFVAGRAITLLTPAEAAAAAPASQPVAQLQQALGPHGTTAATSSRGWAGAAAFNGVVLCLAGGAGAELLSARRMRR